jgi:uncharacterized RDD family membrane protein YckC
MSQALCPSCATPLNPNDQFCGGCGMRVTGNLPQTDAPQAQAPAQQPAQAPWAPQAQAPAQPAWPNQPQQPAQAPWAPQAPAQQAWPNQPQQPAQQWPNQPQQSIGQQAMANQAWANQAQQFGVNPVAQGGVVAAGFGIRLGAYIIDAIILGILQYVGITGILSLIVSAAYFVCFWVLMKGQTPGKMVLGLRVVPVDGKPLDWTKAGLRYVGYLVSGIILAIGFIMVAFDSKKQGLHDKIAGTVVVKKA